MTRTDLRVVSLPDQSWVRAAAVGAAVVATVAVSTTSDTDDGLVLCPFRRCTGTYCPGCGGTRAAGRLLRGDVMGAWHQHPYVVLLAAQLLLLAGLATQVRGRTWISSRAVAFVVANAALMVVLWVVRLGLGDIPGPF